MAAMKVNRRLSPSVSEFPIPHIVSLLPTPADSALGGQIVDLRVDERRKAGSEQRYLLGIIARTP